MNLNQSQWLILNVRPLPDLWVSNRVILIRHNAFYSRNVGPGGSVPIHTS